MWRVVVARKPYPIPVLDRTGEEEKKLSLPSDTLVLLGVRADLDDIEIFPYSGYYKRKYVQPGELAAHYEIRYHRELTSRWTGKPSPLRGRVITRIAPQKLGGIKEGSGVLFLLNDRWHYGEVQEYENTHEVRKMAEKAKKLEKNKLRKYLRQPTIWDLLDGDD